LLKALAWIRQNGGASEYEWLTALRALIRSGVGNEAWLTKHLSTKRKRNPPRTLALLHLPAFFTEILPKLFNAISALPIDERKRDELLLVVYLKATTGIRTGSRTAERELWGTRLQAGKTSLQIGERIDWTVFAKGKEIWHITFLPQKVSELLRKHISKWQIKAGQYLIQSLWFDEARLLLKQVCAALNIPPLNLHDLRKVYLTGLCLSGIPLETAVELNVGWKDLNTARKHYLEVKALNADAEYAKFSDKFFNN